jgi:hypothetical protein
MNIYGLSYEITSQYMAENGRMVGEWRRVRDLSRI